MKKELPENRNSRCDSDALKIVQQALLLPQTYVGVHYLATCLELVWENERNFLSLQKSVYNIAALRHGVRPHCIERGIRTIIDLCWNRDISTPLQSLMPCSLKFRPSVGELLELLYLYTLQQDDAAGPALLPPCTATDTPAAGHK